MVVALATRRQDEYQAFYTNCNYITNYMVGLLKCDDGMSILEPCAGEGAFLDELIKEGKKLVITALELNSSSIEYLHEKYKKYDNIKISETDFSLLNTVNCYERVIANPPYGAYQTPDKRKILKSRYPDIYAKETYGIFLIRAMESLKYRGRLVFIIPDTFLTLHMHEGLRKRLLYNYKIESITLFPSKFFPSVNFGYAGLSIISILNEEAPQDWSFPIFSNLTSNKNFMDLTTQHRNQFETYRLSYQKLKQNPSYSFYLLLEDWLSNILDSNLPTIGSICDVVTGFYSGNDAIYLKRSKNVTRNLGKYLEVTENQINNESFAKKPPLDGLLGDKYWIPIVKGGNRRFFKPSEWFMNWSTEAVYDYKVSNKKKARFQNPQFYFKQGIAVPMVSSTAITGALIEERLFDQSIVGIFPKNGQQYLIWYLLGFFNSKVCEKLIRTINASTNNSSNYIKKIPLIIPNDKTLDLVNKIVQNIYAIAKTRDILEIDLSEMNSVFDTIYKHSSHTQPQCLGKPATKPVQMSLIP